MLKQLFTTGLLGLGLFVASASADPGWKRARFTFGQPISLPGVTLPAGSYDFERHDLDMGRNVIRVRAAETGKVLATLPTVSAYRAIPSEKPAITLTERGRGLVRGVRSVFYPGDPNGVSLVYFDKPAQNSAAPTAD
jgi:hypothetical protein